ncbi:MAG TPA: efflux RND transporter periplasmic adaptor subunit [Candidatus Hydrogenedentes bacterium]|nr:efflux RND transporter periplasmic adaptor subunit [Candidatus Hydrogenedentota bacterium]
MSPQRKITLVRLLRGLILLAVIAAALGTSGAVSAYFLKNRPRPQRQRPPQAAPLVQAQAVYAGAHQVTLRANGTVIPAVEVTLQPQVTGRITSIHPHFLEGGLVQKGDALARIEPRDYDLAIVSHEAQLETARYELKVEEGQQDVAQREWELLSMQEDASALDKELALRKPQFRQKQANLRAAQAQLEKARLDLERTVITAPFNGVLRSADVDVGDLATPQTPVATIVGTDAYWVRVSIPVDDLKWVLLPDTPDATSSAVRVYSNSGAVRTGRVLSLLSDLEPEGRLARLLVEVKDPLDLEENTPRPPLLLGEYVRVEIVGRMIDDVFVVPRQALRDGDELWLAARDDTLNIAQTDIVWSDIDYVLLRGLTDGTRIILSDLAAPVEGMALRLQGALAAGTQDTAEREISQYAAGRESRP